MKQKKEITISIGLDEVVDALAVKYPDIKQEGFIVRSIHGFRDGSCGLSSLHGPSSDNVEFALIDNDTYAEYQKQTQSFTTQHEELKAQVDRIESLLVKE